MNRIAVDDTEKCILVITMIFFSPPPPHQSSAPVFLHRCGLCFLGEAVDGDGDVCGFEDLFQYL